MSLPRHRGFTLVELVVVIAILGILTAFVVPMFTNTQKNAAERTSIANQEAVSRQVQTFLSLNSMSGLNRLDAVIDWSTAVNTSKAGTFDTTLNSTTTVGGVWRGMKWTNFTNQTAPTGTSKDSNNGINSALAAQVCVYYLTATDVTNLKRMGMTKVIYFNPTTLHPSSRGNYTAGMAGSDPNEVVVNAGPGFRVEHDACFEVPVETGRAVLAINPALPVKNASGTITGYSGNSLYKNFGVELKKSDGTSYTNESLESTVLTAAAGKVLLVFGLGQNSSMVGHRSGGIDTSPRSDVLDYTYYRQYMLVIRSLSGATALNGGAEFAGVLDPLGQTVTDARFANEWRNGDR